MLAVPSNAAIKDAFKDPFEDAFKDTINDAASGGCHLRLTVLVTAWARLVHDLNVVIAKP